MRNLTKVKEEIFDFSLSVIDCTRLYQNVSYARLMGNSGWTIWKQGQLRCYRKGEVELSPNKLYERRVHYRQIRAISDAIPTI